MRILIVEDEAVMVETLARGLRREGHAVDTAVDGLTGLEKAREYEYDVVLLDRDLPKLHGDSVCRALVADQRPTRILMLTAASDVDERISGLNLGADDYLSKPFDYGELIARINALGRRPATSTPNVLSVGPVTIDRSRRTVTVQDRPIALTPKEYELLLTLAAEPERLMSAEDLMAKVWDDQVDAFSNVVRFTFVGLRRKLGLPDLIQTVRGAGYRLHVGDSQ